MSMTSRRAARLAVNQRVPRTFDPPRTPDGHRLPVSAYFARHVLDLIKLKERLPREAYQALLATLRTGAALLARGGRTPSPRWRATGPPGTAPRTSPTGSSR